MSKINKTGSSQDKAGSVVRPASVRKFPLRVVKREHMNPWIQLIYYVVAVIIALCLGALLLAAMGVSPIEYYEKMVTIGAMGNKFAYKKFEGLIITFIPLVITSLALSLSFRMKFWNIGGEGQFIVGAISSAWFALMWGNTLPGWMMILVMALGGGICAGIYGLVAGVLKVKFGTNETLMTLMMNYIALYTLRFFGETKADWNIFVDPSSDRPKFMELPEAAAMPVIKIGKFSLNIALIVAVLLTICIIMYLTRTKHGYELSVVGDSIPTARYAGMKVGRIMLRTVFLSAFLIGIAGAFTVSSSSPPILSTAITNDVGWTGIIVAWLSKLNPIAIFIVSALISVLQFGCISANASFGAIDSNFADILQGIILFVVLAVDFLIRFKIVRVRNIEKEAQK